jgi:hypothetical protein
VALGPDLRVGPGCRGRSHHDNKCGSYACHPDHDIGSCHRRRIGDADHDNAGANHEHHRAEHHRTDTHRTEHHRTDTRL